MRITTWTRRWIRQFGFLVALVPGTFATLWLAEARPARAQGAAHAAAAKSSWQTLADMPEARFEMATAAVGGTIYLLGGYSEGVKSSSRIDAFDLAENTWRRLADLPSSITHMDAVVDGRSIWIAGGFKDG